MKSNYTIFLIVLCITLNACHKSDIIPQLQLADSLMLSKPDSALNLLRSFSIQEIPSKSAKAMYALLLTQALDKNYIQHQNDSIISIAIDYYKNKDNNNLKAKSYFYLGRVYQDNEEYVKATEAYLTVLKSTPTDKTFILQVYNNLAMCYENQEFYIQAIKTYKESYSTAELLKDKYGILHATRGLGNIYAIQDDEDSALTYYQTSLAIAQSINDSIWQTAILCDIAKVYDNLGMHIEAKKNIEHALKYAPYNTSFSSIYFWKGIILRNLEETDSAICYLSKAKINADIYAKASIYQTLYEIDKKRKKYEQAILYNDTALVYYDSIQKMVHHTEINSLIKKHSTEMYEQRIESQYQKDKAVLIICILLTISFAIFILMYISNRNKIKYIYLQQLLMKNQTEKAVLKEEIKTISHTNKINEQKYIDIVNKRFELWHQSLQTCVRLFKTTTSYKKIQLIETSKIKREKGVSQEDISLIYQEINEVFTEAMQELLNQYPNLTQEDLYYCILNYLQLSNDTIKKCMRVESQYALNQRKYRIRKQLSNQTFSVIFDLKNDKR